MAKNKLELDRDHQYFIFNDHLITDPYADETGRFDVDPIEYYGLTKEWLEKFEEAN